MMLMMSLFMSSFILSWNYISQNQYSDPTTWPATEIPLEFNFSYICHIQGVSPFLSYVYADRSVHVTALLVHSKNSFWGTQTKNTVKDKCGISLAKDTSADAVFGFVPHILKSPKLFTTAPAECLCKERPCPGFAASRSRGRSFSSSGGREEPELGALSCSARKWIPGLCSLRSWCSPRFRYQCVSCAHLHTRGYSILPLSLCP